MRGKVLLFLIPCLLFLSGGFFFFSRDIPLLQQNIYTYMPRIHNKTAIHHVFVIMEENHDWQDIHDNPGASYINRTLLQQGSYATNYHNVPTSAGELHPSELNYIFMLAGTTIFPDITFSTDDIPSADNSTASKDNLITLLENKGFTWKSYQEDIPGTDCPVDSIADYAPRHNPFVYFQQVSGNPPDASNPYCKAHVRPFSELQKDLATGSVPNYVFITPNLQHDMHDGTVSQADSWLSQVVPAITNSSTFKKDGALFITWDEGSETNNGNNPIGMIMLSPFAKKGYTNDTEYSHASLLKSIEEIFQLQPLLGDADSKSTKDLLDFFTK